MIGSTPLFRRRLLGWYHAHRRDLPWRVPTGSPPDARPDPYAVLVSEVMLQQTQVATVVGYFHRFMARFPTITALAGANDQELLRVWQGLGYYSRAKNLRRAAGEIVSRHGGVIPSTVEALLELPGVGRYTAGAIASLAFDRPAPILDGNVTRVLCRLDGLIEDPRSAAMQRRLWGRASELVPDRRPGHFNSALMELGATVCTPRAPACLLCPVRAHCVAAERGNAEQIPPPRKASPTPLERRVVLCLFAPGDRPEAPPMTLLEQRPPKGRWAGLWQWVTFPAPPAGSPVDWSAVQQAIMPFTRPKQLLRLKHQLTHRRYEFEVFAATATGRLVNAGDRSGQRKWLSFSELDQYPLSRPHALIAEALRSNGSPAATAALRHAVPATSLPARASARKKG